MKHLLLSVFAIVLVLTSCNSNGVNRVLQEKDSLQRIVDSIHSKAGNSRQGRRHGKPDGIR